MWRRRVGLGSIWWWGHPCLWEVVREKVVFINDYKGNLNLFLILRYYTATVVAMINFVDEGKQIKGGEVGGGSIIMIKSFKEKGGLA